MDRTNLDTVFVSRTLFSIGIVGLRTISRYLTTKETHPSIIQLRPRLSTIRAIMVVKDIVQRAELYVDCISCES